MRFTRNVLEMTSSHLEEKIYDERFWEKVVLIRKN